MLDARLRHAIGTGSSAAVSHQFRLNGFHLFASCGAAKHRIYPYLGL